MKWYKFKEAVLSNLNMSHDMAHMHLGLAAFLLLTAMLQKHSHHFAIAWLAVVLLTLGNETLDAIDWVMWTGQVNWPETSKDILNTIIWPTVLWALAPLQHRS